MVIKSTDGVFKKLEFKRREEGIELVAAIIKEYDVIKTFRACNSVQKLFCKKDDGDTELSSDKEEPDVKQKKPVSNFVEFFEKEKQLQQDIFADLENLLQSEVKAVEKKHQEKILKKEEKEEKKEKEEKEEKKEKEEDDEPFASLLRNSKFVDLGDPQGKRVVGEIYRVVDNDLYIDFGWKFPTVCKCPPNFKRVMIKGQKVEIEIKELELTTKFLGSDRYTNLLEADCILIGKA